MTKQEILEIFKDNEFVEFYGYVWGMPGPDLTFYKFSDYGKTWALTEEEIKR